MLVQIGDAVVADRDVFEERQGPRVSCADDDVVYVVDGSAVNKVDGPIDHFRD